MIHSITIGTCKPILAEYILIRDGNRQQKQEKKKKQLEKSGDSHS